jgi:hypothetical protein
MEGMSFAPSIHVNSVVMVCGRVMGLWRLLWAQMFWRRACGRSVSIDLS